MSTIFTIIFLTIVVSMILGLIKPSIFHKKPGDEKLFTRKKILVNFGLLAFICMILIAVTAKPSDTQQLADSSEAANMENMSAEEQIEYLVRKEFEGQNNLKKDYLREVRVVEQDGGGYGVFAAFNAGDNFTTSSRLTGIKIKMSEVYIILFTSGHKINKANLVAYFPLVDQYGNENDRIVYESSLDSEVAQKVNWGADEATLQIQILPNLWTATNVHPEFRGEE